MLAKLANAELSENRRTESSANVAAPVNENMVVCGIPLQQGGLLCGGKEIVTPELPLSSIKQFPSTIQKLPLLLRDEMKPYSQILPIPPCQFQNTATFENPIML